MINKLKAVVEKLEKRNKIIRERMIIAESIDRRQYMYLYMHSNDLMRTTADLEEIIAESEQKQIKDLLDKTEQNIDDESEKLSLTAELAKLCNVPDEKILKSVKDIDKFFTGES